MIIKLRSWFLKKCFICLLVRIALKTEYLIEEIILVLFNGIVQRYCWVTLFSIGMDLTHLIRWDDMQRNISCTVVGSVIRRTSIGSNKCNSVLVFLYVAFFCPIKNNFFLFLTFVIPWYVVFSYHYSFFLLGFLLFF